MAKSPLPGCLDVIQTPKVSQASPQRPSDPLSFHLLPFNRSLTRLHRDCLSSVCWAVRLSADLGPPGCCWQVSLPRPGVTRGIFVILLALPHPRLNRLRRPSSCGVSTILRNADIRSSEVVPMQGLSTSRTVLSPLLGLSWTFHPRVWTGRTFHESTAPWETRYTSKVVVSSPECESSSSIKKKLFRLEGVDGGVFGPSCCSFTSASLYESN